MKKRILAHILALCFVIGMMPMTALATEVTVDTWDGATVTEPTRVDNTVTVDTAAELAHVVRNINTYGGCTIEITKDLNLNNHLWTSTCITTDGGVTFNGNNKTITGLKTDGTCADSNGLGGLFSSTGSAGAIVFNDLTISGATIEYGVESKGVGVFIGYPGTSESITFNNCHVVGANINGGDWTGGFVGYAAGFATQNNGPIFETVTLNNCTVTNSTIKGLGSTGGIVGHATGDAWTQFNINNCTVSGNTIENTSNRADKVGSIMGTVGCAGVVLYENNGGKPGGVYVTNTTVEGNAVKAGDTVVNTIYGRQGNSNGLLVVDGEAVFVPANAVAVVDNSVYYPTLPEAIAAAEDGDTITVTADISDEAVTVNKSVTITGDKTLSNVSITASGTAVELTVSNLKFTGSSYINANDAAALTVTGVEANVNPTKITGRAAFIVLGTGEPTHGLKLTATNNKIYSAQSSTDPYSAAIFGWRYLADGTTISNNTFGSANDRYNFIAVKTMNAMSNATITLEGNTVYGSNATWNFKAFDLYQNCSRDNTYTVVSKNNVIDIDLASNSTYTACAFYLEDNNGAGTNVILLESGSTVNGEALTMDDVDASGLPTGYNKFYGINVTTNANGEITGGTFVGDPTDYVAANHCVNSANSVYTVAAHGGTDDGNCTTAVTCTNCGEEVTAGNATHNWANANGACANTNCTVTCTETHAAGTTCATCGMVTAPVYVPVVTPSNPTVSTDTTVNTDGSTTTTETKADGTVTQTTTNTDGSTVNTTTKTEVQQTAASTTTTTTTETKTQAADGTTETVKVEEKVVQTATSTTATTTTTTATAAKTETVEVKEETVVTAAGTLETTVTATTDTKLADGTTATTTQTAQADGTTTTTAAVTVPAAVSNTAAATETAVNLPIPAVTATTDSTTAVTVTVTTNTTSDVKVAIPVAENSGAGTVAVIVNADGTETVATTSKVTGNGLEVTVPDGATIKVVDNSTAFEDVKAGDWEKDAVDFVSARGIMNGTSTTTNVFDPDTTTTRAQVWTMLARLSGVDTSKGDTWYEAGQTWAVENGVSDGTDPNAPITREQLATMLWRYMGEPTSGYSIDSFDDYGETSSWAYQAEQWAVESGIINGINGKLNPTGDANRAQVATMFMRIVLAA